MRLVVTGGAGFVGSALIRSAVQAGHDIINYDALTASATLADIWDLEDAPNYALMPGDVTDLRSLSDVIEQSEPDAVIHLAQEGPHSLSDDPTSQMLRTNVLGMETVLRACHSAQVPRIVLAHAMPARDTTSLSPYRASHESARLVAKAYCDRHRLPVVNSFAPAAFGPRQSPADPIAITMRRLVQGRGISIPDGPRTAVDLIFVDDYADALLWAATDAETGGSYTFTGPRKIRPLGVARQIANALQRQRPVETGDYRDFIDVIAAADASPPNQVAPEGSELVLGHTPYPRAFNKTVRWALKQGQISKPPSQQADEPLVQEAAA